MVVNQSTSTSKNRFRLIWKFIPVIVILALLSLYILNASTPGRTVEGCPDGWVRAGERNLGPLRVLSLNMLHGFPKFVNLTKRTDLIAAEIKRLDADVVLLQEVPWTRATGNVAEVIAKLLGYNYLYYRANGNRNLIFFEEGEAILSRYALKDVVFTTLAPHAGWFERRVAFGATAITPWGEVMFFVVHLTDKKPQVNEGQTEALRNFVEQHSKGMAVVAGDFNARAYLPQIRELAMVWIDAYRFVHPNDEGLTCCIDDLMAIPGEPLEERIDYIFLVHMEGKLVSAEHTFYQPFVSGDGWQWASDHTGLLVEIAP